MARAKEMEFRERSATSFGERLRALRNSAKLSQQALADLAGMTQSGLIKLELGTREPSLATAQKLAAALGVSCEAFNESSEMPPAAAGPKAGRPRSPVQQSEASSEPKPAKKKKGKGA